MRIVIDGSVSGFDNNGGTLTNFKSAEALASLGHDVYCLANKNKFTWFRLKRANYVTQRPFELLKSLIPYLEILDCTVKKDQRCIGSIAFPIGIDPTKFLKELKILVFVVILGRFAVLET